MMRPRALSGVVNFVPGIRDITISNDLPAVQPSNFLIMNDKSLSILGTLFAYNTLNTKRIRSFVASHHRIRDYRCWRSKLYLITNGFILREYAHSKYRFGGTNGTSDDRGIFREKAAPGPCCHLSAPSPPAGGHGPRGRPFRLLQHLPPVLRAGTCGREQETRSLLCTSTSRRMRRTSGECPSPSTSTGGDGWTCPIRAAPGRSRGTSAAPISNTCTRRGTPR